MRIQISNNVIAVLSVVYGIPYLGGLGYTSASYRLVDLGFLLIPLHLIVMSIFSTTRSRRDRIVSFYTRTGRLKWFIVTVAAIIAHMSGWIFLSMSMYKRWLVLPSCLLLVLAHCLMLPHHVITGWISYLPVITISAASFCVHYQLASTTKFFATQYAYILGLISSSEEEAQTPMMILPSMMVFTDAAVLALILYEGFLEFDDSSTGGLLPPPPPPPTLGWWEDISVWEEFRSYASWWQGLGTAPCNHSKEHTTGLKVRPIRCRCCDYHTQLYFSEYVLLTVYVACLLMTSALSFSDYHLMIISSRMEWCKAVSYAFIWVPHFLYTCSFDQRERRKKYMFGYWSLTFLTCLFHLFAINRSTATIRYASIFTEFGIVSLLPEAVSDAVAEIGFRGGPHKRSTLIVLLSAGVLVSTLFIERVHIGSLQTIALALSSAGVGYPLYVITDKVNYILPEGRPDTSRRSSSVLSDLWWARRPGSMPSEPTPPLFYVHDPQNTESEVSSEDVVSDASPPPPSVFQRLLRSVGFTPKQRKSL